MFTGRNPFVIQDGELTLKFKPNLASWLFPESNQVEFLFLGHTFVTYRNPLRLDTWKAKITSIDLIYHDGRNFKLDGDVILSPYALEVREGKVKGIINILGENGIE
jgi:hypothetical protein